MSVETGGRRRQRAVMATDTEWALVRERAAAARMDVSRFVVERLTAPAGGDGSAEDVSAAARDLAGAVARVERMVRVLHEVERQRMEDNGEAGAWEALVRRAEARVATEERLG